MRSEVESRQLQLMAKFIITRVSSDVICVYFNEMGREIVSDCNGNYINQSILRGRSVAFNIRGNRPLHGHAMIDMSAAR
jgi:hypothetical protein